MQNGWALILHPKSDYIPCLLGARCLAVGRLLQVQCRPPTNRRRLGVVGRVHWGRGAHVRRRGSSPCAGLAALAPWVAGLDSFPLSSLEGVRSSHAMVPQDPAQAILSTMRSRLWRLPPYTATWPCTMGSGMFFCTPLPYCGQFSLAAPSAHCPAALGSGQWGSFCTLQRAVGTGQHGAHHCKNPKFWLLPEPCGHIKACPLLGTLNVQVGTTQWENAQ